MKKVIFFSVIFLLCNVVAFSQSNKLDSLWQILNKAKQDSTICRLYIEIGIEYETINPDSAIYYYNKTLSLTKSQILIPDFLILYTQALQSIGWVYCNYKSKYDTATAISEKALKIYTELSNSTDKKISLKSQKGISQCYNNIGVVYMYQGSYDKALEYYLKSLEIFKELGDKNGISVCYNYIGLVHWNQGNYDKALEYYLKSLKIFEELGDKNGMSKCYNNIGLVNCNQGNFDKALKHFLKSLKITEESGDKDGISKCYNNIAIVHKEQGLYDKAFEYYLKSLKIKEELGDKKGIALVWGNISELHIIIADSVETIQSEKTKHYNEAVNYGLKSLNLAREIKAMRWENLAANNLMDAYKKLGNYKKSMEYAEIFIATNDSMFKEEKTKALADMEGKYQNETKQKEIISLTKEKQIQSLAIEKTRNFIILVLIIAFLLFILLIILFRHYKVKQKTSRELEGKNNELGILNKKLTDSESELIKLNSSKDKFFSIISHDLKNPLSAFKSITKFLSSSFYQLSEKDKYSYIYELYNSSEQLHNLMQNLLQWAISQSGVIKTNPLELNLSILVFKAVILLKPKSDEKRINVISEINENTLINYDPNMIYSVLINLISNAVKYTEPGGMVTISSRETNEFVEVLVSDTGIGISPDDIDKLFKIETDHKTIGNSIEKGTGLGLILCREFVEKNGGKIWIESQLGKGSIFYFTIPRKN